MMPAVKKPTSGNDSTVIVVHPEVVVHPVDEEPTNNNDEPLKNEAEYFVRYFSEDHKIWNDAYHFWIHDHMFESSDECCVRNDVVHMELDLNSCMDQNTARTYDPSCEPFRIPYDDEYDDYEGRAPEWVRFIKDAYREKAAERRPFRFCNPVTHVLIVFNITRDFKAFNARKTCTETCTPS
eukprot:4174910-Prymnesium_polylepis.1